jgi:hypothetical protein
VRINTTMPINLAAVLGLPPTPSLPLYHIQHSKYSTHSAITSG